MHNANSRLETFCDGVYAIAITLLILELKVPLHDVVQSRADLWHRLGVMWPSWFAFALTFLVISISWANHHRFATFIERSSPQYVYATCFFLLTVVVLPFATALLGEYLNTDYAQPAVVVYCSSALLHNVGWLVLFRATHKPAVIHAQDAETLEALRHSQQRARTAFLIYLALTAFAVWFPRTAMVANTLLWFQWLRVGLRASHASAR